MAAAEMGFLGMFACGIVAFVMAIVVLLPSAAQRAQTLKRSRCSICAGHNVDCHFCGASRQAEAEQK